MAIQVFIRHPQSDEHDEVRALIRTVANETFAELFAPDPVPLKLEEDDWSLAWVAVCESKIIGVTLTREDSVSDLWIFRENRRSGVGSRLLACAESEIASRGYRACRLRVVKSNIAAVEFYLGRG